MGAEPKWRRAVIAVATGAALLLVATSCTTGGKTRAGRVETIDTTTTSVVRGRTAASTSSTSMTTTTTARPETATKPNAIAAHAATNSPPPTAPPPAVPPAAQPNDLAGTLAFSSHTVTVGVAVTATLTVQNVSGHWLRLGGFTPLGFCVLSTCNPVANYTDLLAPNASHTFTTSYDGTYRPGLDIDTPGTYEAVAGLLIGGSYNNVYYRGVTRAPGIRSVMLTFIVPPDRTSTLPSGNNPPPNPDGEG